MQKFGGMLRSVGTGADLLNRDSVDHLGPMLFLELPEQSLLAWNEFFKLGFEAIHTSHFETAMQQRHARWGQRSRHEETLTFLFSAILAKLAYAWTLKGALPTCTPRERKTFRL